MSDTVHTAMTQTETPALRRCDCGGQPALAAPSPKSETRYAASVVCYHCGVAMIMADHDSDPARVIAAWNRRPDTAQTETPVAWVPNVALTRLHSNGSHIGTKTVVYRVDRGDYLTPLYTADALASAYRRGIEDAAMEVLQWANNDAETKQDEETIVFGNNAAIAFVEDMLRTIAAAIRAKGA